MIQPHLMKLLRSFALDFFCVGIILFLSLSLISFYFSATYINTEYEDWMVHAFRAKFIQEYGFISWTHLWSNGINVLAAYQFIPHLITIATSIIFNVTIPRAMVIVTITIFTLLHLETYGFLRLLKFSRLGALTAALLTFSLTQYWSGVGDYSLQFAFLFFPPMIYLWARSTKQNSFSYPFLVGFSFYIHPILAFFSGSLFVLGLFISKRKIISLHTFIEVMIIILSSALFWYPIIFKDSFVYREAFLVNKDRLGIILNSYPFYGLSLGTFFIFFLSIVLSFKTLLHEHSWIKKLVFFNGVILILAILSARITLPPFLTEFQFTRGMVLLGISMAFTAPLIIDSLISKQGVFKYLTWLFILLITIEALINISSFSPRPGPNSEDIISAKFNQDSDFFKNKRIFVNEIGNASYFNMDRIRLPYSWMSHFDSNPVSPRLGALIIYSLYTGESQIPFTSMKRIDDYIKVSATDYVVFDSFSPFSKSLKNKVYDLGYESVDQITTSDGQYDVFEPESPARNAVIVDPTFSNQMNHFPFDLDFSDNNNFIEFDNYVHNFANIIYSEKNVPIAVKYPDQESISINIPEDRPSNMIYIAESYGKSWKAEFNGVSSEIKPVGPNFMMVTLPSNSSGTLKMKHSWPSSMIYILAVVIIIPFLILVNWLIRTVHKTTKHKKRSEPVVGFRKID